jgi:phosphatidylserine/phosphatidylglycerophosphate/cardiolipin synthase-like enzyme
MDKEAIEILGKRFSVVRFLLAILLSAVELYLGILYSLYAYALIAVALTLIAGYFASITGNRNISMVMPKRFVHAKMYISENEAISGSANLTYRGMHRNVEMLEIMHDKESVESMSSTFWKMWKEYS